MLCRSKGSLGEVLCFSVRGTLLHLIPIPSASLTQAAPPSLDFTRALVLAQLWADAAASSPAAEMPLCSLVLDWGKKAAASLFAWGNREGSWREARSSATNLLPSSSFPFLSQVFPLSPSLSHFSDFLKMKAFCFYLSFCFICSQSLLLFGGFRNNCLAYATKMFLRISCPSNPV